MNTKATPILLILNLFFLDVRPQNNYYQKQWTALKPAVSVSFVNSNIRYKNNIVPQIAMRQTETLYGWKGEKLNSQIIVFSSKEIKEASFGYTDLKDAKGNLINKTNIKASFIKYVWTDGYFGNGCGKRNNQQLDSSLVADLIDTTTTASLSKNSVQPVWLGIKIPPTTKPGIYKGKLFLKSDNKVTALSLIVNVQKHQLPEPSQWSFDLDLWQYPVAIAKFHRVPLWSEEHYSAMKPYYTMLANAGQKVITISMIEGGNQGKEVSPAMIKFIKKEGGAWSYDYSLFDKYVSFMMSCGINKRINCYTMVPWSMEFSYYDETTGRDTSFSATTQSPEFKLFWQTMLKDFTKHLKEKNWFKITAVAMDERKLPDMQKVISIIREVDSEWNISLAGGYHEELVKEIFDYSIFKAQQFSKDDLLFRKQHDLPTTFYTSCEGEKPNMFTFSSPAESVWMGWYASAKGFSGYLRWAYNLWSNNTLTDSRGVFPAGDAFQIYPGPRSSVRFEKLIEGIQDFEKIKILKEQYKKSGNKKGLEKLNKALIEFDNERLDETSAETLILVAKKILNEAGNE